MALSDLFQKWTQPYDGYTPQQVDTRRLLIAQMLNQGRQADSVGEGLVALAGGIVGGIQNKKLDRTEEAGRQSAEAAFNAAMGGWSPFAAPMMGSAGDDTLGTGGPLDNYANAIAGNESGGNYQAIGPQTRNGDRAYGKYQVMGSNVGPWTEKYVGRRMSPQEFLADPQAQEAVFRGEFGSYVQQYGNPQDAASMWFSGKPLAQAGNASDGYMTVPDYVSKFTGQLGGGAGNTAVTGQAGADVLSGGSGNTTAIYQALANPWLSQEQRAALMQMLEQNDPLRQLQLQEAQMRVQQMQQPDVPDPAQYGTTLNYFQKQDGTLGAYVLGNDGNPKEVPLPDGAAWAQGVDKVDLGTEYALIDKRTGALIGNMPKDVASEAAQRAAGAKTGEAGAAAAMDLPNVIAQGDQAISLIHSIMTDPALPSVTGMFQGRLPPMTQEGTDLAVKIDQLKGKTFLEAFASLKGGGAITEREGQAAQEAVARLNRAQSTDAYIKALNELAQIITTGVARAKAKAGMPQGAAPATGMVPPTAPADDPLGLFQ